jgi:hypothetical protein
MLQAAELKDTELQVKTISVTLGLLYGDLQFRSVYRPSKETLKLFRIKQLIS